MVTTSLKTCRRLKAADYYFSDDLLSEILKRLLAKSLFRCRYVSKSWYNLIQSPLFITTHFNYQKTHGNKYLLFDCTYDGPSRLALRSDDVQCSEYYTLERLPGLPQSNIWCAPSNGLICLAELFIDYHTSIYLWSPAIRKFRTLPDPPPSPVLNVELYVTLAFGFSPKANDFEVVKLVTFRYRYQEYQTFILVYSLSTNSWKMHNDNDDLKGIDEFHLFDWAFVNGTVYFRAETFGRRDVMVSYDTYTDVVRKIPLPEQFQALCCHYSLQQFGESLALFLKSSNCENGLNVWVLKESDPNEEVCWEKKITISLDLAFDWRVLGLRSNGEVILRKQNEYGLVSYDVDKKETRDFAESWNLWSFVELHSQADPFGDDPPPFIVDPFVEGLFLIDEK